mmetsp:Transcript_3771/g.4604  ORF Transcript_3771/g.4604 Transcript_3771/m.4604 type:complete len:258 (-) Transcript_3771:385-1158(-)
MLQNSILSSEDDSNDSLNESKTQNSQLSIANHVRKSVVMHSHTPKFQEAKVLSFPSENPYRSTKQMKPTKRNKVNRKMSPLKIVREETANPFDQAYDCQDDTQRESIMPIRESVKLKRKSEIGRANMLKFQLASSSSGTLFETNGVLPAEERDGESSKTINPIESSDTINHTQEYFKQDGIMYSVMPSSFSKNSQGLYEAYRVAWNKTEKKNYSNRIVSMQRKSSLIKKISRQINPSGNKAFCSSAHSILNDSYFSK